MALQGGTSQGRPGPGVGIRPPRTEGPKRRSTGAVWRTASEAFCPERPRLGSLAVAALLFGRQDPVLDSRRELLDALCDQIVTAVGVAYMLGMDIQGALNEVNRSNWSKFVDGKAVFNEQGKIAKSENYTPPQLVEFVK